MFWIAMIISLLVNSAFAETKTYNMRYGIFMSNSGDMGPEGTVVSGGNFDYFEDGTSRVRYRIRTDTTFGVNTNSIVFMGNLRNSRKYFPRNWGLFGVYDEGESTWYRRNNETGEYDLLNASPLVTFQAYPATVRAVKFENELIGGGETSLMWHFDGDSLFRFMMQPALDTTITVTVVEGGALDTSKTHGYRLGFKNRSGWMSYASILYECTTTATARKCSLSLLPKWPREFTDTIDTTQISLKYLYRYDGVFDNFLTAIPRWQTTFVDSGQFDVDPTIDTPPSRPIIETIEYMAVQRNKLWTAPPSGVKTLTSFRLDTTLAVSQSFPTPFSGFAFVVTPSTGTDAFAVKATVAKSALLLATYSDPGDGTWEVTEPAARFVDRAVVEGDYVVWDNAGTTEGISEVLGVISQSRMIVTDPGGAPEFVSGTVGNNIYQIDDEIFGIGAVGVPAYTSEATWIFGTYGTGADRSYTRGLFGTAEASHDQLANIYRIDPRPLGNSSARSIYRSEVYEPIRMQTQDPYGLDVEAITGMFAGDGYVGATSPYDSYAIREDNAVSSSVISYGVGNIAPRGLVPVYGGALTLDRRGIYFLDPRDGAQLLSDPLGDALSDSSTYTKYRLGAGTFFDTKAYYSIEQTDGDAQVWIADFSRQTPWGRPIWSRYHSTADSVSPTMWQAFGDATYDDKLYFAGGNSVYYLDTEYGSDIIQNDTIPVLATLTTPRIIQPGFQITMKDVSFTLDTRDSVSIDMDYTTRTAYGRSHSTYSMNILTLSPTDGDVSIAGKPRQFIKSFGTNARTVETAQFRITVWGTDSDPTIIYPFTVKYDLKPVWRE